MGIIYKMLWKLLIDKDMNKGDLQRVARISASSVVELSKGADIQTDILARICETFDCDISDIVESVREEQEKAN